MSPEYIPNFQLLVEKYFGKGTCQLPASVTESNNITGALNNSIYGAFTQNFRARLKRLARVYSTNNPDRPTILHTIRQVTGKSWQGSYAEIAAYDYFSSPRLGAHTFLTEPPRLNVDIDSSRTYAKVLGKSGPANLDGHFEYCNVFFDVKVFKDNLAELLAGVYDDVRAQLKEPRLRIQASYSHNLHYEELASRRSELIGELVVSLSPPGKISYVTSKVLPEFSFRILWGPGMLISEHSYGPYQHAELFHGEVFNHIDKFVRDAPSLIVYVVFPWFNLLINDLRRDNEKFYRAFARRVFCQYRYCGKQMIAWRTTFAGPQTIWDVSKDLAGIVFLEDRGILGNSLKRNKINAYWYVNPNANNHLFMGLFEDMLVNDLSFMELDTFGNDNY